jgi:hypothetical protein
MESIGRVASVASTAAARAVSPFGEASALGLVVGQTVHARVTRVEGDTVQLRWGEQTLNVASKVQLSVGQQVSLAVEEGGAGKMLLRMVDDTFGRGRQNRPGGNGAGRGGGSFASGGGRPGSATSAPGLADQTADISPDDLAFWGADPELDVLGGPGGRSPGAVRPNGGPPGGAGGLGQGAGSAVEGDSLTALLFESLDGAPARSDLAPQNGLPGGLAARAAMPTYGKLAQSVGGAAAFGQLLATLGPGAGQTLARAPLAPSDLGCLLVNIGVHPDETNAVLVGEMLTQGVPVNEGSVRRLRRDLAAAGGSLRDAAPAVALSRLGLPITPLSLAIARQLQAGQLDPKAAWGELLSELHGLMREAGPNSQAGMVASELLSDWRVPVEDGVEGISRWLRSAVDQAATPLEAKLTRAAVNPNAEQGTSTTPGQDVRARLDLLAQAMPGLARGDHTSLSYALQRTQATIQAEQILNGAATERTEQRFFVVTLPTVIGQQPSTLELRVRERDAHRRQSSDPAQPDVVQMTLSLPSLGDLGINLMVGQHSVSCHFSAGSQFAEALLNASSGELVGRLKRLGFAHTSVDAAHERIEPTAPPLAAPQRVSHVDLKA